jgi:hypothetical protein
MVLECVLAADALAVAVDVCRRRSVPASPLDRE